MNQRSMLADIIEPSVVLSHVVAEQGVEFGLGVVYAVSDARGVEESFQLPAAEGAVAYLETCAGVVVVEPVGDAVAWVFHGEQTGVVGAGVAVHQLGELPVGHGAPVALARAADADAQVVHQSVGRLVEDVDELGFGVEVELQRVHDLF